MSESVYAFLSVLNNLAVRMLIDSSTKRCKTCGESHIEAALDDYAGIGNKSRRCVKGKFISKVVAQALNNGGRAFGVSSEQLRHSLSDPYVKRGISNVLVGAATFGITKPQTVGAPFLVVWNYTNACNLRCKHCYQNSEKTAVGNLSTAQRKQVVDQLAQENVVAVAFSGGEPLMSSDFFEVAGYASKNGLYVSMASNGTLITPSVAHKLKDCGVGYVDVSLDGAKAETHETFRGVSGCFDKTLAGIRNLVNEGITACVAVTVTQHNLSELPDIFALAKTVNAKRVIVFNFIPTGRAQEHLDMDLTPFQREQMLEKVYDELLKGDIEALCTAPQLARVCLAKTEETNVDIFAPTHFYAADLGGKIKGLSDFIGGCGAGRIYCAVQPNGAVTPCVFMPIVVGDLTKQTLNEIWRSSPVLRALRDREKLKGECGKCQYKYICGGCRARAYAYTHDVLAPEQGCIKIPEMQNIEVAHAC